MGAVLAMMGAMKKGLLAISLVSVWGCGPLSEGTVAAQVGDLVGDVTGRSAPAEQAAGSSVGQDEVLNNPGKYMRVNIRNLDRWDTMIQSGTNGRRVTWVDSANNSLTLDRGIVVATRGLSRDLMAADVSQTVAAIRSGGGTAERRHEFLSNQDQVTAEVLQCRIVSQGSDTIEMLKTAHVTTKFEESCSGPGLQFANVYWVNRSGKVIRSLQAVSPDGGYLQIDAF